MAFRPTRASAICLALLLAALMAAVPAGAEERRFRLAVPDELAATGFPKYLLPRFTLKHATRVTPVGSEEAADAALVSSPEDGAVPVFDADGTSFALALRNDSPHAARFAEWLTSDVGRRTIEGYPGKDVAIALPTAAAEVEEARVLTGNAATGLKLSRDKCGRCHVVDDQNRMRGIGSTPSFFVLRALGDWQERFSTFYVRNPHPAFTQIPEITDPFPEDRPSPIHPIELTAEGLDDILAYVTGLAPADLGAPIQSQ